MIKKLRWKFVWLNTLFMLCIFALLLGAFCASIAARQREADYRQLERALDRGYRTRPHRMDPERPDVQQNISPGFCVKVDLEGNIVLVDTQVYSEISEQLMREAVDAVLRTDREQGLIRKLHLRYMCRMLSTGQKIAFLDISAEQQQMQGQAYIGLLVLLAGTLAAFGVAYIFSGIAIRPVQQAWVQQKQFVADASHEIKTPLTVVLTNADILLQNPDATIRSQQKWVEYIKAEAERMRELVENMLFLAKSDAGKESVTFSRVNFSEIVWNHMLPLESIAYEKGVTIESDIAPEVFLEGHAGQLGQLVVILLDNACKYAPPGSEVFLQLSVRQDRAVLLVRNAAEEVVPPEKLAHIFDRFYRVDEARTRGMGGYGLGLAIAKAIAEQHGAKIWAESSPEEGMTFFVDFGKNARKCKKKCRCKPKRTKKRTLS